MNEGVYDFKNMIDLGYEESALNQRIATESASQVSTDPLNSQPIPDVVANPLVQKGVRQDPN